MNFESKEVAKFQIGRNPLGSGDFEVYDTASSEDEAVAKYAKMVSGNDPVSNPEQIYIYEAGAKAPRMDLMEKVQIAE